MSHRIDGHRWLATAGDALVIVAAAAALALLIARGRSSYAASEPRPLDGVPLANWKESLAFGTRVGNSEARVEIIAFVDYQCPSCRQLHLILADLVARYGRALAISTIHFPLRQHPYAVAAANAAECAARQGRFAEMNAALYQHQIELGIKPFQDIARIAGVGDGQRFVDCMTSTDTLAIVRRGIEKAVTLRLPGTPALVVDGLLLTTIPDGARLRAHIERVLKSRTAN